MIPFAAINEAKIKAERVYKGITPKWKESSYSDEEIRDFLRDEYEVDPDSQWWTIFCSFCGRNDSEFGKLIYGKRAQICGDCIKEYYELATKP